MNNDYRKYIESSKKNDERKLVKEKAEALVNGKLSDSKPSAFRNFKDEVIKSDFSSITSAVISQIIIPKAVDLISNAFESGLYMLFHGDLKGYKSSSNKSNGGRTDYTIFSSNGVRTVRTDNNSSIQYRDVCVADLASAESIVMRIEDILDAYGEISVADIYSIANIRYNNDELNYWGWRSIRRTPIVKTGNGYIIKMPKPERL